MLISSTVSWSCVCVGASTVDQAFKTYDFIVLGKVLKVEKIKRTEEVLKYVFYDYYFDKVTISINIVFKGNKKLKTIDIFTMNEPGTCGYGFTEGQSYFIYGYYMTKFHPEALKKRPKVPFTSSCLRTTNDIEKEIISIAQSNIGNKYKKKLVMFQKDNVPNELAK